MANSHDSFIQRVEVTRAEHQRLKADAGADGRTLNAYLRGKLGLSFVIDKAQRAQVIGKNVPSGKNQWWEGLSAQEKYNELKSAKEAGFGEDSMRRPIDGAGNLIRRNMTGEWVVAENAG